MRDEGGSVWGITSCIFSSTVTVEDWSGSGGVSSEDDNNNDEEEEEEGEEEEKDGTDGVNVLLIVTEIASEGMDDRLAR